MTASSVSAGVPQFFVAALALGAVLLLIWGLSWLARRAPGLMPAGFLSPSLPADQSLALRGSLRLDARRRLYLVQADGQAALVLTGGATEVIVRLTPPG